MVLDDLEFFGPRLIWLWLDGSDAEGVDVTSARAELAQQLSPLSSTVGRGGGGMAVPLILYGVKPLKSRSFGRPTGIMDELAACISAYDIGLVLVAFSCRFKPQLL